MLRCIKGKFHAMLPGRGRLNIWQDVLSGDLAKSWKSAEPFFFSIFRSLRNLVGILAALLLWHPSNFSDVIIQTSQDLTIGRPSRYWKGPRTVWQVILCHLAHHWYGRHLRQGVIWSNLPVSIFYPVSANENRCCRDDSRFAHNQWETALLCNDLLHWLGANLESARCCTNVYRTPSLASTILKCVVNEHWFSNKWRWLTSLRPSNAIEHGQHWFR